MIVYKFYNVLYINSVVYLYQMVRHMLHSLVCS